jgi:hypothetical protein
MSRSLRNGKIGMVIAFLVMLGVGTYLGETEAGDYKFFYERSGSKVLNSKSIIASALIFGLVLVWLFIGIGNSKAEKDK